MGALKTVQAHEQQEGTEKAMLGFWTYLMTDLILFATLFATYAVLRDNTAGGPAGRDIFDAPFILIETLILLTSSFTSGLAMLALKRGNARDVMTWLGYTFVLGAAFLGMELYEFNHLVSEGESWRRSAFLSAFFTLVGTHGLHIAAGLLWMATLIATIRKRGLTPKTVKGTMLLCLFWHFLDIVWIFIFTIVYMMGLQT